MKDSRFGSAYLHRKHDLIDDERLNRNVMDETAATYSLHSNSLQEGLLVDLAHNVFGNL